MWKRIYKWIYSPCTLVLSYHISALWDGRCWRWLPISRTKPWAVFATCLVMCRLRSNAGASLVTCHPYILSKYCESRKVWIIDYCHFPITAFASSIICAWLHALALCFCCAVQLMFWKWTCLFSIFYHKFFWILSLGFLV